MHRHRGIVVLALTTVVAGIGCGGGGDARRSPRSAANVEGRTTTTTTSAALTTTRSDASSSVSSPTESSANANAPVTTVRVAPRVEMASVVVRVATARCDREVACAHVGTGRAFADREECVNAIGHDVVGALPAEACPLGVDPDRLGACVAEIGARSCDADTADDDASPSCAPERLCAQP